MRGSTVIPAAEMFRLREEKVGLGMKPGGWITLAKVSIISVQMTTYQKR